MIEPGRGFGRAVRAGAVSASALTLAAVAHSQGGMPLSAPGLGLAAVAITPLTWAVSAGRMRTPALVATLAAGQLLAHLALVAGHGVAATRTAGTHPAPGPLPIGQAAAVAEHSESVPALSAHTVVEHTVSGSAAVPGWKMLAGHALATLLMAALLARGERLLWRITHWLFALPEAARLPVAAAGAVVAAVPPPARDVRWPAGDPTRGPPLVGAAARWVTPGVRT
ncbi:MAG TPA: hypothetical protein PLK69_09895 [Tetrasphaera sp.]|nr:hypothetical protein [Tetrasphaera sp.]